MRRLREAGCSEEELEAAIYDAPASETAWLVGADGEARVGEVLEQWATAKGFALLIDVTPPGQLGNIDFIAVGRAGVVVVDAKAWSGALRFNSGTMWIGRHGKSKDVAAVERQVEQVVGALAAAGVVLPVRGMLCMANDNPGLPGRGLVHLGEIGVGSRDEVGRAIGRRGALGEVDVERAVTALRSAFDMRGFIPQTVAASRPRLGPAQRRVAGRRAVDAMRFLMPVLRWALQPRNVLALACLAVVLHVVGIVRSGKGETTFSSASPPDLQTALPALRTIASHAAHGAVRGPAVDRTTTTFRLTFRRARCRVIVRVDRRAADYVAGASITKGLYCRR